MTRIEKLRNDTYLEAKSLLEEYGKCAIIRPTGFGKTGILTKFIRSGRYKNILYLHPADVIKNAVLDFYYNTDCDKTKTIPGVTFMSYMKLATLKEKDIKKLKDIDLIICDECHRLGAPETMDGMNMLLSVKENVHILGATATPERMDMIDEIAMFFDDHITSKYTLHDAFKDGILKKPYYCFCAYGESDPDVISKIKKDYALETIHMNKNDREAAQELLESKAIEIANLSRMDYVFKSTLEETNADVSYQKYIVFFRDFEHMNNNSSKVKGWLKTAFPSHNIRELTITSENETLRDNVNKLDSFKETPNTIDLIYSCNMLNMGYHINDLTGIMMYRGTYSSIVYIQQLGRALSTGDTMPKIVFDIVDNIHRKSIYAMLSQSECKEGSSSTISPEIIREYESLVKKLATKTDDGKPVIMSDEDKKRLAELSHMIKIANEYESGKRGSNRIEPSDLIVTSYAAKYRELIAKTVAEPVSMRCRQAWQRWLEKGGDASIMTKEHILGQKAPQAVPLPPFCRLKNVSINAVLDEMGITT